MKQWQDLYHSNLYWFPVHNLEECHGGKVLMIIALDKTESVTHNFYHEVSNEFIKELQRNVETQSRHVNKGHKVAITFYFNRGKLWK